MPAFNYEDYEISDYTGFAHEIQESLPEYFHPWHDLATNMADYVEKGTMREETHKIPQLDSSRLQTYGELRLAHVQLSFIVFGYAWGSGVENAPESIPANIAVPFCDVSDRTGLEAGNSASSFSDNFRVLDRSKPATMKNLEARYQLPGGNQSSGFWMLCTEAITHGKDALPAISRILEASKANDTVGVAAELRNFATWFDQLREKCTGFKDFLDPEIFFHKVSLYFKGFNEVNGYPDGILFEGVKNNPRRKSTNISGGQTVTIPTIEHILGITYPKEQEEAKSLWKTIMPFPAQRFFKFIHAWPGNVKQMVADAGPESDLAAAYNEALRGLSDFRSYHIQLVTKYFILPSKRDRAARNDTSEDPLSVILPQLKEFRSATDHGKI